MRDYNGCNEAFVDVFDTDSEYIMANYINSHVVSIES